MAANWKFHTDGRVHNNNNKKKINYTTFFYMQKRRALSRHVNRSHMCPRESNPRSRGETLRLVISYRASRCCPRSSCSPVAVFIFKARFCRSRGFQRKKTWIVPLQRLPPPAATQHRGIISSRWSNQVEREIIKVEAVHVHRTKLVCIYIYRKH